MRDFIRYYYIWIEDGIQNDASKLECFVEYVKDIYMKEQYYKHFKFSIRQSFTFLF